MKIKACRIDLIRLVFLRVSAEKSSVKPFPKINISISKHQNNFGEVIWVEDFSAQRDKNMYMRLCMYYTTVYTPFRRVCVHEMTDRK